MNPLTLSRDRHQALVECLIQRDAPLATSRHFSLYRLNPNPSAGVEPGDMVVIHDFAPHQIDNNIGYYVANELLPLLMVNSGVSERLDDSADDYSEKALFERFVGAIVRSMDSSEKRAWRRFYANTLNALRCAANKLGQNNAPHETATAPDFIANFAAIYQCAMDLVNNAAGAQWTKTSVLDVASCFGFFPLLLATQSVLQKTTTSILGCDLNPALVELANGYAQSQKLTQVQFIIEDICAPDQAHATVPVPRQSFDVVTALHFLEHLETIQTVSVVARLWQLTKRRLIIAVPLEETPDARFGHRQTFNRERLLEIGQKLGGQYRYFEYYGGWLVVDRMQILSNPATQ